MKKREYHGHANYRNESREYHTWKAMIQRCENPINPAFPRYGGRGIRICKEWRNSFSAFLGDMGERPLNKSLDRFPDNNGNYEPGNCRWATRSEQGKNRRRPTHCKHGHVFNERNTYFRPNTARRTCRQCQAATVRSYKMRNVK